MFSFTNSMWINFVGHQTATKTQFRGSNLIFNSSITISSGLDPFWTSGINNDMNEPLVNVDIFSWYDRCLVGGWGALDIELFGINLSVLRPFCDVRGSRTASPHSFPLRKHYIVWRVGNIVSSWVYGSCDRMGVPEVSLREQPPSCITQDRKWIKALVGNHVRYYNSRFSPSFWGGRFSGVLLTSAAQSLTSTFVGGAGG